MRISDWSSDVCSSDLPAALDFATAASLGCRFVTSFRAIVDRARVAPGDWVAVHGCGGVGLSAIMIASAMGAKVIAVDLTEGTQIGRASCWERERQYGYISVVAFTLKKKTINTTELVYKNTQNT